MIISGVKRYNDSNFTSILTDWFQSFNPSGDYLDPAMQGQMLPNYLCIFTAQGKWEGKFVITLVITADWSEEGSLDSLVKCQWFQWDEGNDCIAERFAQGTQVFPILEINDHLCMEPVSWRVLNSFKISGRHRKQIKCQWSLQESSDFVVQWLTSANTWHAWRVHSCQCASQVPGMVT